MDDTVCMTYKLDGRKMKKCAGKLTNMHIANKNSLAGGKGTEEQISELENWHITNKDSLSGGDEEGGAGW